MSFLPSASSLQIPSDFHYLVPNTSFPSAVLRDVKHPSVSGKMLCNKEWIPVKDKYGKLTGKKVYKMTGWEFRPDDFLTGSTLFCNPAWSKNRLYKSDLINEAKQILFILYKTPLSPDIISIIMTTVIRDINFKRGLLPELMYKPERFRFYTEEEREESSEEEIDSEDEEQEPPPPKDDSFTLVNNLCEEIEKDYYGISERLEMPYLANRRWRKDDGSPAGIYLKTRMLTFVWYAKGGIEVRLFTKYHQELILKKLENQGLKPFHSYDKDFTINSFRDDFKDYDQLCKDAGCDPDVYEKLIKEAVKNEEYIIQAWWCSRKVVSNWDDANNRLTLDVPHGHYGAWDDRHLKYHIQFYNNQFYIQKDMMSKVYGARQHKCIDVWTYKEPPPPKEVVEVEEEPEWKSYTPAWVLKYRIRPNLPIGDNNWFLSMMNDGTMGENTYNSSGDYIMNDFS